MNNDFAIESFIDYCDSMVITTEAVNMKKIGKNIWDSIIRIFRKLATWFKNLLLNINYFKNAELSEKMNKDMLHVLQVSQARTEDIFKQIPLIHGILTLFTRKAPETNTEFDGASLGVTGDGAHISRATTFKDQISRMMTDITENMDSAKESDAYKRLMKNEYDDNKKLIPLSNIIPDMKKSNSGLTAAENSLSKMQNTLEKVSDNPSASKVVNMISSFLNKVITYYNFRISLLSKYFTVAKASLKGLGNNISEIHDKNNKSNTSFKHNMKHKKVRLSNDEYDECLRLYRDAQRSPKITTYEEYKPVYTRIIQLLKIKPMVIDELKFSNNDNTVTIVGADETNNTIHLSKNQKLYHTSPNDNITSLNPRWRTPGGVLFPTPRIYFHTSVPLDRFGNKADTKHGGNVYVLINNPSEAHVDKEMGLTAVYIETTSPLRVKKIDYKEFKQSKEIDFKLD